MRFIKKNIKRCQIPLVLIFSNDKNYYDQSRGIKSLLHNDFDGHTDKLIDWPKSRIDEYL